MGGRDAAVSLPPAARGAGPLALALALAGVALAQPARLGGPLEQGPASEPVDLVLVVGTAITMGLEDYVVDGRPVDRMTLARQLLDGFVAEYSGRRIGLVVLGDPPALWLPLTRDKAVVRDAVGRLRVNLGGRLTDIAGTLELVAERFGHVPGAAVVMFSDAGFQVGREPPLAGARALSAQGLTLHTVALGAAGSEAGEGGAGRLIHRPVDLALLRQLAAAGGGEAFHATDAAAFEAALATVEARHRRPPPPATAGRRRVEALYAWPLAGALVLVLVAATGRPRMGPRR